MATASQIAANQANASIGQDDLSRESTGKDRCARSGPITPAGQAASALNNLNHGFRSAAVLLPTDDPAAYESLLAELTAHFNPCDLTEDRFVREMTGAEWRLRRVRACMASAIARQMEKLAAACPEQNLIDLESRAIETLAETGCSHATWLRYETKFENQYDRNYRAWIRYQEAQRRVSSKEADIALKQAIAYPLHAPASPEPSETGLLIPAKPARSTTATGPLGSNVQTARSAPCPCGSGEKYKRCCGRTAAGQVN